VVTLLDSFAVITPSFLNKNFSLESEAGHNPLEVKFLLFKGERAEGILKFI
jgi:hypothetical protein